MNATKPVMAPEYPDDPSYDDLAQKWGDERRALVRQVATAVAPERKQAEPMTGEQALAQLALFGVNTEKLLPAHTQVSTETSPYSPVINIPVQTGREQAVDQVHVRVA